MIQFADHDTENDLCNLKNNKVLYISINRGTQAHQIQARHYIRKDGDNNKTFTLISVIMERINLSLYFLLQHDNT